jgi:hypothetical protein
VLTAAHAALLAASAISVEVAAERGYYSVGERSQVPLDFGRNQRRAPALVIPLYDVFGEPFGYQLRPDEPRTIRGKVVKYETPTKQSNRLDVPPRCQPLLDDSAVPLVFTEGARKADAGASRGIAAISVNGVWGWRGTNGKGGKTALPDFGALALNGRRVLLAFDSDAMTKAAVHEALRALAAYLELRGADVGIVLLPADPSGRKVGLDDFLAAHPEAGLADLEALAVDELAPLTTTEPADTFDDVDDEPGWLVLEDVAGFIGAHVHFSRPEHPSAVALWIAHTHAMAAFDFTPRLHLRSAVKRSGKSRLLEVLERLCRQAIQSVNISPAALYRLNELEHPTWLIDEVDQLFGGQDRNNDEPNPIIGLINGGFRRGNKVHRTVGQGADLQVRGFDVFGPVALAGIGRLVDTVADRAITVNLERLPAGLEVEPFRHREVSVETALLSRRLAAWVYRHLDELSSARPPMPAGVTDRAADIWEPCLAVADVAGGKWPQAGRDAAVAMVAAHLVEDSEITLPVRLLADIRAVWPPAGDRMFSRQLVAALNELDDSPWSDMRAGAGITTNWLAGRLRPFGISSKDVRMGADHGKGYEYDDFTASWDRFGCNLQEGDTLSGEPGQPRQTGQVGQPPGGAAATNGDHPDVADVTAVTGVTAPGSEGVQVATCTAPLPRRFGTPRNAR